VEKLDLEEKKEGMIGEVDQKSKYCTWPVKKTVGKKKAN